MTSYTLRRLWKKIRGQKGYPVAPETTTHTPSARKIILANRVDGLGERLCAMINAIRMSAYYNADFRFVWTDKIWNDIYTKTDPSGPTNLLGQSIASIENIFAPAFIKDHAVSAWSKEDFDPLPTPAPSSNDGPPSDVKGWYTTQHHLAQDYGANIEKTCPITSMDAFQKIGFHPDTAAFIERAQQIDLPEFTALHLRSGDMVYGDVRKWGFWGNKVINPVIALDIIKQEDKAGRHVIVFGQDIDWLRQTKTTESITFAYDLLDVTDIKPHQRALFEIILMSRASTIIAGDSGFARAASMIGNLPITGMFRHYSPIRYSEITVAELEHLSKNLHPYMTAYAYWQAYAFGRTLRSVPDLIQIIEKSHHLDPGNYLYLVILAALHYRMEQDEVAENLLAQHYGTEPKDININHPLNQQIIFRYFTPQYTHQEQFTDYIAAARRPNNKFAKYVANLIETDKK